MPPAEPLAASYILPLRWSEDSGIAELAAYLSEIDELVAELIVVDGSPQERFAVHREHLPVGCVHVPPDPDLSFAMGKVDGVITGVRRAGCEAILIADDDVRYDEAALRRIVAMLAGAELVRPQNYFRPLVWHARWDTGRSLLNRVFNGDLAMPVGDFPGTLAVRRSAFLDSGAYDGDALFENLELMRTIRAAGGRVASPLDLYVARRPPASAHFLSQRVRQAYDSLAMPLRLAIELSLLPALLLAGARRPRSLPFAGAAVAAVAEFGRRRAGGARVFPASGSLLAPAWLLERAVTSWLAVIGRVRHGGVRYGTRTLSLAAHSQRELLARRRAAAAGGAASPAASARSRP